LDLRFNEFHIGNATGHAPDKRQADSTKEREVYTGGKRAPDPTPYFSLVAAGFLVVEFGHSG
jgi:hypothetical protein